MIKWNKEYELVYEREEEATENYPTNSGAGIKNLLILCSKY